MDVINDLPIRVIGNHIIWTLFMTYRHQKSPLQSRLACILIAITASPTAYAADLFRWQDEKGNTHYTDQVPPEYMEQGYRVISEQGLTIRTIKSTREIESSQPPSAPQKPKELPLEDQRLLMTYSSEEEIISTRTRKLADTKAMLGLTQETIELLDTQFRQLAKKAGDYEKRAKPVPSQLLTQISTVKKKIENHNVRLKQGTDNMTKIEQEFDETLQRYRQLTSAMNEIEQKP